MFSKANEAVGMDLRRDTKANICKVLFSGLVIRQLCVLADVMEFRILFFPRDWETSF
jgi:hypothetical protein